MRGLGDGIRRRRKAWLAHYRRRKRGDVVRFNLWRFFSTVFLLLLLVTLLLIPFRSGLTWLAGLPDFFSTEGRGGRFIAEVRDWLEKDLGLSLSLLPTLQKKDEESVTVFSMPLRGTVVEDFKSNGRGVILETGIRSQVHPIGTGWVRFVGKTKNLGITVMIQHGDGKISLYGYLGEAYVKKDDWVYPDMVIGLVSEQSLYLSVFDKDQAIDPLDVIAHD